MDPNATATLYANGQAIGTLPVAAVAAVAAATLDSPPCGGASIQREANIEIAVSPERGRMLRRMLFGRIESLLLEGIKQALPAYERTIYDTACIHATPGVMLMYAIRREHELREEARQRGVIDHKTYRNGTPLRGRR